MMDGISIYCLNSKVSTLNTPSPFISTYFFFISKYLILRETPFKVIRYYHIKQLMRQYIVNESVVYPQWRAYSGNSRSNRAAQSRALVAAVQQSVLLAKVPGTCCIELHTRDEIRSMSQPSFKRKTNSDWSVHGLFSRNKAKYAVKLHPEAEVRQRKEIENGGIPFTCCRTQLFTCYGMLLRYV